jgi:hypothetical protein
LGERQNRFFLKSKSQRKHVQKWVKDIRKTAAVKPTERLRESYNSSTCPNEIGQQVIWSFAFQLICEENG